MPESTYETQGNEPIYPKILWNRPLSRHGAGRFMVVGGHKSDFSQPTALYGLMMAAGAGECVVALPDSLSPLLSGTPSLVFVPSSVSGSIGRDALGRILDVADDADAMVLGASLSSNSETATLTERLLEESTLPLIAFGDAFVAMQFNIRLITDRKPALIVMTLPELIKLATKLEIGLTIRRDGGLPNKVEIVRAIRSVIMADLVVYGTEVIVATDTHVSVTPTNPVLTRMPAAYAAVLAVFWLQHRSQVYQALTTAAWVLNQAGQNLNQQETPTVGQVAKTIAKAIDYEPTT